MRGWMAAIVMLSFACTPRPDQPVDPVWGKQACAHCMMLVSDPRPAAQVVLAGGARKYFDDVGCLVVWLRRSGQDPMHAWVRAHDAEGWTDAYTARYSDGHRTPMDYGFLSSPQGRSFEELQAALRARSRQRAEAP